jgi:hypothetical protein
VSDKSWRHKWQKLVTRDWSEIRASWLGYIPRFPGVGSPPDPGLEKLSTLLAVPLPDHNDRFPDVPGLRVNALWEAVFLFHKCAHTHLAAQRIGQQGMHSWSLFNAYHSAYLGAHGIMTLLGVPTPLLGSVQIAIDLFPEPVKKKKSAAPAPSFQDFIIVRLGQLNQRYLWEAFQRVIKMTKASCWDVVLRDALVDIDFEDFSRPRNKYLYRAGFWPPLSDLMADTLLADFNKLFGKSLDIADEGFLLRLCFSVYRLFEQLMTDLASQSGIIKEQLDSSRIFANAGLPTIECYANFVSQVSASAA